ncbi:MAG: threonine-phosphate decarboxylase CobD [Thermoleophilia bacterium]
MRIDLTATTAPGHGGRREEAARRYGIPRDELLDFSASISLLGPPAGVTAAIRKTAGEIAYYPEEDAAGLRSAMADYLGVFPDEIVPGNGSIEVIYWLLRTLAPARALIVEPTFSEYRRACLAAGTAVDAWQLQEEDSFALDVRQLRPAGHDLVCLCNPNNPTGYLIPPDELAWLWRQCRVAGAELVVDEAFIDFAGEGASLLSFGAATGLHVVRSFTKSHALAGLRLGCLVTDAVFARRLRDVMPPWNINAFAAAAGIAAMADGGYLLRLRCENTMVRAQLFKDLAALPGLKPLPSEANFILCRLERADSGELAQRLARTGILVRDCRSFEGLGDRYIRVAVRPERENYQLVAALRKALA